ncbi:hypothetical protein VTK26DRAFT_7968 [Humicola hyalothermophila]
MTENKMQLEDWLDDLCVRFIIHLPKEDLSSVARICFQVEEAQWFYEDFIRPLDPTLPSMSLRSFCLRIFQHCPLLAPFSAENHMRAFEEFLQYKTRVPVRGAILLNEAMDSTVLVKGWKKSANWSFPRGKINKDEDDLDCAIREVYEETGFDIRAAGLVPKDDEVKYIQISMREQQIRLYVFRNIPMDTVFQPKTRKEISKVQWYKLSELPAFRKKGNGHDDFAAASNANKFYMVAPFLVPLKKWVVQQKKKDAARAASNNPQLAVQAPVEEPLTEDDIGTQTEPVAAVSNGTPAIETLEGATKELQRLLKVQPPTQGLQMGSSGASGHDKGEALMALLQKSAAQAPPQQAPQFPANNQAPHTSLDLTYTNAPEPHTTHHHHPGQRLPGPNYQAPPSFPIPAHVAQNALPGYFQQGRAPPQGVPQGMPQVYGRNPFMNPPPNAAKEPVLLHPQPLPPQVQQSLLTRGILPTPTLPDTTVQSGSNPFAAQGYGAHSPQRQAPKQAQLTGHAMALLNAFKTGAPSNNENAPGGRTPQGMAGLGGNNQQQSRPGSGSWGNLPNTQPSDPPLQYLPHHMAPVAPMRTSPRAMQPSGPSIPVSKPGYPAQAAQTTDSHRSILLDMFKRSGPKSPLSNEIKMQPQGTQHETGFTGTGQTGSPAYKAPSAAEVLAPASSDATPGQVPMNSEVSLPFRPVQILSRPKQGDAGKPQDYGGAQAQMYRLHQRLSPRHEPKPAAQSGLPSPRHRASFHQGEPEARRSPQFNYAAAQAASLPYAHYPSQPSPSSANSVLFPFTQQLQQQQQPPGVFQQRRKDSNPEQRQKLLSLFASKPQQQPSSPPTTTTGFAAGIGGVGGDDKGKAREQSSAAAAAAAATAAAAAALLDQQSPPPPPPGAGTPRSRLASFASVGGDGKPPTGSAPTSRRGSQTPISPADRSFLLSYLETVTGSSR